MKVFLGADHRGFELKEKLKEWLKDHGYSVEDLGAYKLEPGDDYPDFAAAVAEKVAGSPGESRGILLCGSGAGMDAVANKVRGVRATVAWSQDAAAHSRSRDDVNVITLPADWVPPVAVQEIVRTFLETEFGGAERDLRRLKKIEQIEARMFR